MMQHGECIPNLVPAISQLPELWPCRLLHLHTHEHATSSTSIMIRCEMVLWWPHPATSTNLNPNTNHDHGQVWDAALETRPSTLLRALRQISAWARAWVTASIWDRARQDRRALPATHGPTPDYGKQVPLWLPKPSRRKLPKPGLYNRAM